MNAMRITEKKTGLLDDESYDVVLNMGPYYHLTGENDRKNAGKNLCLE